MFACHKIKMETYSNSELTIGLFGGSMDSVDLRKSMTEIFDEVKK